MINGGSNKDDNYNVIKVMYEMYEINVIKVMYEIKSNLAKLIKS